MIIYLGIKKNNLITKKWKRTIKIIIKNHKFFHSNYILELIKRKQF